MKILITGICGFVGSTLAREWLKAKPGIIIYGIDNLIRTGSEINRDPLQKLGVKLFHGDIRVQSDFCAIPKVDWVIDAAANPSVMAGIDGKTSSRQLVEHNLCGTINMLEFCKKYNAGFILISTSRVYSIKPLSELEVTVSGQAFCLKKGSVMPHGITTSGVSEEFSTTPPVSLYGSTKLASELLALEYGDMFNFPVWINRCGVLAGAGQFGRPDQGIFSFWINAYLRKVPLKYIGFGGSGYQVRDAFHPHDLMLLLQKQMTGKIKNGTEKIVNLGGGTRNAMSLAELSLWCKDRFGMHKVSRDLKPRPFDIPWMVMDCSLAKVVWNWEVKTSMEQILSEIAEHALKNRDWLKISGVV